MNDLVAVLATLGGLLGFVYTVIRGVREWFDSSATADPRERRIIRLLLGGGAVTAVVVALFGIGGLTGSGADSGGGELADSSATTSPATSAGPQIEALATALDDVPPTTPVPATRKAPPRLEEYIAVVASTRIVGQTNPEYVLPQGPGLLASPEGGCRDIPDWALAQGGVLTAPQPNGFVVVELVIQGKSVLAGSSIPVSITGVTIDVTSWASPLSGTRVRCEDVLPLTDAFEALVVEVTLPEAPGGLVNLAYSIDDTPLEDFRRFEVAAGDTEYVDLVVDATGCLCEWIATLHAIIDGEKVELEVTDDGVPFRFTGASQASPMLLSGDQFVPED